MLSGFICLKWFDEDKVIFENVFSLQKGTLRYKNEIVCVLKGTVEEKLTDSSRIGLEYITLKYFRKIDVNRDNDLGGKFRVKTKL